MSFQEPEQSTAISAVRAESVSIRFSEARLPLPARSSEVNCEAGSKNYRRSGNESVSVQVAGTVPQSPLPRIERGMRYLVKPAEWQEPGEVFLATSHVRESRGYALSFSGIQNGEKQTYYSDVFPEGYSLQMIALIAGDRFDIVSGGATVGSFRAAETPAEQRDITDAIAHDEWRSGLDRLVRFIESDRPFVRRHMRLFVSGDISFTEGCPHPELAGKTASVTLVGNALASNLRLPIRDSDPQAARSLKLQGPLCMADVRLSSAPEELLVPLAELVPDSAFVHPDLHIFNRPLRDNLIVALK